MLYTCINPVARSVIVLVNGSKRGQARAPPHQNLAVGLDGDGMPAVSRDASVTSMHRAHRLGIGADDSELVGDRT